MRTLFSLLAAVLAAPTPSPVRSEIAAISGLSRGPRHRALRPPGNRCTNWQARGMGQQRETLRAHRRAQGGPGLCLVDYLDGCPPRWDPRGNAGRF